MEEIRFAKNNITAIFGSISPLPQQRNESEEMSCQREVGNTVQSIFLDM